MVILYAENDPDDAMLFEEAIEKVNPNISCVIVDNGQEAVDYLQKNSPPTIIFLDLNMPLMDGLTCLRHLKSQPRFKNIPAVIYTTSTNPHDHDTAVQLGATYLCKMNSFGEMINAFRTILAPHQARLSVDR